MSCIMIMIEDDDNAGFSMRITTAGCNSFRDTEYTPAMSAVELMLNKLREEVAEDVPTLKDFVIGLKAEH